MKRLHLILALVVAAAASLAAGLAVSWLAGHMPCHGETLACNIDGAVGAYGTIIWAVLGPLIFGVTLFIAGNRTALAGAALVLLLPLIAFILIDLIEGWRYVGFYPYPSFRTFLAMFAPPASAVLVQYLILRLAVPSASTAIVHAE
jgi:hypothetical protein